MKKDKIQKLALQNPIKPGIDNNFRIREANYDASSY